MPEVNGRLTCCVCGADLGDAGDIYADPDCVDCINREVEEDVAAEEAERLADESTVRLEMRGQW